MKVQPYLFLIFFLPRGRVKFLAHNGRRILLIDLSNIDLFSELRLTIAQAKIIIGAEPENSIYTLTDITDIAFAPESTNAVKGLAMHDKPYVIAGAVVGVTGLRKVVF